MIGQLRSVVALQGSVVLVLRVVIVEPILHHQHSASFSLGLALLLATIDVVGPASSVRVHQ